MKTLFVGGDFDDEAGRKSKLAETIFENLGLEDFDYLNGGHYNDLLKLSDRIKKYGLVFWLAKTSGDKPLVSPFLKKKYNSFVLVSSKRNLDNKLSMYDLVAESLSLKSNLAVEFSWDKGQYFARIFDPLGNVFLDYSPDMALVGKVLGKRARELVSYSRAGSRQLAEEDLVDYDVANPRFIDLIKSYAGDFHKFVYGCNASGERFLGNASFRCAHGFPSFKAGEFIFVSKRNVDKRELSGNSFVAVKKDLDSVNYFGTSKPSVDTPIQLALYNYYPEVNFMLHSHAYLKDAPFTENILPCGVLQEVEDITRVLPEKDRSSFKLNLRGHGSLVAANSLDYFFNLDYYARPIPEVHENYQEGLK